MDISTVCLIAKNEERAILEWIAYQKVIGFDRVVIYDNDSSDSTAPIILKAASIDPFISYVRWPNLPGRRPQLTAYGDALVHATTPWIAFFDTDEFLVLKKHASINDYLASMAPDVSAVAVNWLVFGSGGRDTAGDGLVIDRFTRCAPTRHGKNRFTKVIARVSAVSDISTHYATLATGRYANGDGTEIPVPVSCKTDVVAHSTVQLNHYLLKSREEFELKRARGHAARSLEDIGKQHIDDEFWLNHDINDSEDTIITELRFAICAMMKDLS